MNPRPSWSFRPKWVVADFMKRVASSACLYIELLAFVPAVWTVCRPDATGGGQVRASTDVIDTRKRTVAFFAFLIGFYITEDVIGGFKLIWDLPLAACGHAAHFLLLLDFAVYLLAHLYDPEKLEKLVGSFMHLFSEACAV